MTDEPDASGVQTSTVVSTTTVRSKSFTAAALRELLCLPDDAEITVAVPGGGDWSHTDLEIDDRTTLNATWTRFETRRVDPR